MEIKMSLGFTNIAYEAEAFRNGSGIDFNKRVWVSFKEDTNGLLGTYYYQKQLFGKWAQDGDYPNVVLGISSLTLTHVDQSLESSGITMDPTTRFGWSINSRSLVFDNKFRFAPDDDVYAAGHIRMIDDLVYDTSPNPHGPQGDFLTFVNFSHGMLFVDPERCWISFKLTRAAPSVEEPGYFRIGVHYQPFYTDSTLNKLIHSQSLQEFSE
jgi:hypothetical protein